MEKQMIHKYIHKADLNFECIRMMAFFQSHNNFDCMTICSVDTSEEGGEEWQGFVSQVKKTVVQEAHNTTSKILTRLDRVEE